MEKVPDKVAGGEGWKHSKKKLAYRNIMTCQKSPMSSICNGTRLYFVLLIKKSFSVFLPHSHFLLNYIYFQSKIALRVEAIICLR